MNRDTSVVAIAHAAEDPKKGFRATLQSINFTGTEAQATNGFVLAIVPYETKSPALLNVQHFKTFKPKTEVINLEEKRITSLDGTIKPIAPVEGTYPKTEQVRKHQGDNTHFKVGLSVDVLTTILEVMKKNSDTGIALEFSDNPRNPIFGQLSHGVELTIMPFMITN